MDGVCATREEAVAAIRILVGYAKNGLGDEVYEAIPALEFAIGYMGGDE